MSYYDDIIHFYTVLKHSYRVSASLIELDLNGSSKRVTAVYSMNTAHGIIKPQHWYTWNSFTGLTVERVETGIYDFYRLSETNIEHDPRDPYSPERHYFKPRTTGQDWHTSTYKGKQYLIGELENGGYVVIVRE